MGKAKKVSQLRILSAGTSANFTVGLAVFLLLVSNAGIFYATISPFYQPNTGVLIVGVVPNSAAANASVPAGWLITNIHNATIQYSVRDEASFQTALSHLSPGQSMIFDLQNATSGQTQNKTLTLGTNPTAGAAIKAFVGVTSYTYYPPKFPSVLNSYVPGTIAKLYSYIFLFSVGIAAVNMLPIWGFDGDRVVKILLEKIWGRHKRAATYSLTAARILSILIIALAVITTYALHGQVSI